MRLEAVTDIAACALPTRGTQMSWDIILTLIALVWVCTPAKYDPAIKLKEWLERKDR